MLPVPRPRPLVRRPWLCEPSLTPSAVIAGLDVSAYAHGVNVEPTRGPVFLTGMMGSGKTTVGEAWAERCGAVFVDLDRRIESIFGQTVEELFRDGEDVFRARERRALTSLLAEPGFANRRVIVATGGGVVVDERNRRSMASIGRVFFLDVPVPELAKRLGQTAHRVARPILADADDLRGRLDSIASGRMAAYRDRSQRIDGSGSLDTVLDRLVSVSPDLGERAASAAS